MRFAHIALFLVVAVCLAPAQAPSDGSLPATSGELAEILKKLEQARSDFEVKKREIVTAAIGKFSSAAASEAAALRFYFECQSIVNNRVPDLDGTSAKEEREEQAKTKQQIEAIEDTPGRAAMLQLQIQYLIFTMEAPAMKDRSMLVQRMRDFAAKAVSLLTTYAPPADTEKKPVASVRSRDRRQRDDQQEQQARERARRAVLDAAKQGAMGSVFAQAYNLQNCVEPVENWPQAPLDLSSVYTGIVLPWYRAEKPEMLSTVWDEYLAFEAAVRRCSSNLDGYARWLAGAGKGLQWNKWKDLLANGRNPVLAADELAKLCKENFSHPSVGGWIAELGRLTEQLRKGEPLQPDISPSPKQILPDLERLGDSDPFARSGGR